MDAKRKIAISGANGQLGLSLKEIAHLYEADYDFIYCSREELDIADTEQINAFFQEQKPDLFFNFAAYTNVDLAEEEKEKAFLINATGAENLAIACREANCHLIHISTDYVYPGIGQTAFKEDQAENELNVYGASKRAGEIAVLKTWNKSSVIRTSWLYSKHKNNFVKSMIRYGMERNVLTVVNDQIGSPTWTRDLLQSIFVLIQTDEPYGIFNYSNEGKCSWYDFAKSIMQLKEIDCQIKPIPTKEFPRPARRPGFSLMDKSKIKAQTQVDIPHWEASLKKMLSEY